MIALRPRDQHVRDPRPLPHETEAETKTNYCETETETGTKKVVSRPQTLTSLLLRRQRRYASDIISVGPLVKLVCLLIVS